MQVIEPETAGRLPARMYAIEYKQEYGGNDGKGHVKTLIEFFSHKRKADEYAAKAETMRGWKVRYLYAECKWVEAKWEEVKS